MLSGTVEQCIYTGTCTCNYAQSNFPYPRSVRAKSVRNASYVRT